MQVIIHRGTHQIGGSCVELETGGTRILFDFGMPLQDVSGADFNDRALDGKSLQNLIDDNILFDIKGLYRGSQPSIDAVIISHSHKDHYGFLPYINPKIPVYLSKGAYELVRVLCDNYNYRSEKIVDVLQKALILESHHSTHIEGTALSLEQAKSILEGKKVKGISRDDEKELLNYKKAMDFISKYLGKDDPVNEGIVRELHKILVKGVRGENADPGNYRKIQNYVVNSRTREVVYTPPAPLEVSHLMREFTEWINKAEDASPILVAGIAQFQFVHIHPFIDGNGRTARLLSTLILYKTGYDFKRLFTISEYYDKDRSSYYQAIQTVRKNNMDMTTWLEYFVDGLRSQMTEIQAKGEQLIKQDSQLQKIKKIGLNKRQEKAVKHLIIKGTLSVNEYQSVGSCIRRTAQRDLEELVEKKIVKIVAKSATDPTKHYVLL